MWANTWAALGDGLNSLEGMTVKRMEKIKVDLKKYIEFAPLVALALVGTYGVSVLCMLSNGTIFTNSLGSGAVFVVLLLLVKLTREDLRQLTDPKVYKKRLRWGLILAFIFALSLVFGYQLRMNGMTDGGFQGKLVSVLKSVALGVAIWPFANGILKGIEGWTAQALSGVEDSQNGKFAKLFEKKVLLFLSLWLLIFECWIPVFLAYYPAIMSYDFHRQSIEAMLGFEWFNAYQPLAHTWLFWVAFQIGEAAGSLQFGMACYTLVQMLVFAAAGAYSCVVVYKLCHKKWAPVLVALFWALFPFVSVFAVCTTKDVYFSALFVVFMCMFVELTFLRPQKSIWMEILWVAEGIVMMLFRNNAIYAVAVFAVCYLLLGEKKRRFRMLVLCLLLCIGGKGALEGMHLVLGTQIRGSKVEMFSVPINQFARVGNIHGETLEYEDYLLIDAYVPQQLWEKYNPWISDPIKGNLDMEHLERWEGNYGEMLLDWAKVGLHYPNEYIDAFLHLTSGYWFIDDVSWAEVLGYGREGRMGAIYTYTSNTSSVIPEGIAQESYLPGLQYFLEGIVSDNQFFKWPVVSNLFKPAFYTWLLLGVFLMAIYTKQKDKWVFYLLPLAYMATMLLGPVAQSRYILPIMVVMPLLLAVFGYKKKEI